MTAIKISKKQLKQESKSKNKSQTNWKYCYQISAQLAEDKEASEIENRASGKFILATNVIHESQLSQYFSVKN
ncbi:hypothetical protein AMR41_03225 [Hapalosiphon sp. MRB220]|nr:hypothetical protein AMR41_03225 [Hapalosiphon sp. MRB220]